MLLHVRNESKLKRAWISTPFIKRIPDYISDPYISLSSNMKPFCSLISLEFYNVKFNVLRKFLQRPTNSWKIS